MKLTVIISSGDSENAWNAFRFANLALGKGDEVKVFLLNSGVECLENKGKYETKTLSEQFEEKGGKILACRTCAKSRNMGNVCEISNMETLYNLIRESERTAYF